MKQQTFYMLIGIIIIIFVVLFAFGSCKRKKTDEKSTSEITTDIRRPFDAQATIKVKDLVIDADINKTAVGKCSVVIKKPKSLEGMKMDYDGEKIVANYKGMSIALDENSKLAAAVVPIIINTIDKAGSPSGIDVMTVGKTLLISGTSDSGKFSISADKQKGSVIKISVPELDFECNFSDFIFKKQA
ncbi:MAG: hypothetical protein RR497_06415 [Oscillospiraceae bacterium]